jgi:hypothetical protein
MVESLSWSVCERDPAIASPEYGALVTFEVGSADR